mmetsp:Transcript_55355/g.103868  ORF Transcript_55355/g.103868 Transcript_55355/m.103868 type:complete len:516 (-) Transcript_55355:463-2010(-)
MHKNTDWLCQNTEFPKTGETPPRFPRGFPGSGGPPCCQTPSLSTRFLQSSLFRLHSCPSDVLPVEVDGLHLDLVLGQGQVKKAVGSGVLVIRRVLRGNATSSSGDEAGHATQHVPLMENGLRVRVASDQQIQAQFLVQLLVPAGLVSALEVSGNDLPCGGRLLQLLLNPFRLGFPGVPHELETGVQIPRAARAGAVRPWRIVRSSADIMLRIGTLRVRIHGVGVQHVDLHREVGILHPLHEVLSRHDPPVAGPGVGDLLIPGLVELETAIVMVSEYAEPWLAINARAVVDALKDLVELVFSHRVDLVHGSPAIRVHTSPVKIVADVDDQVGIAAGSSLLELVCHVQLCMVVRFVHVVADGGARAATHAGSHLRGRAPASPPCHGVGSRRPARAVLDHAPRVSTDQTSPVADGEDVVFFLLGDLHRGPRDAVVLLHGLRRFQPSPFADAHHRWPTVARIGGTLIAHLLIAVPRPGSHSAVAHAVGALACQEASSIVPVGEEGTAIMAPAGCLAFVG